jgi:hypothetical protein
LIIYLQMPESIGVETFVCQLFVSEAAHTYVRGVRAKHNRAKLTGQGKEVFCRGMREARAKVSVES